MFKNIRRKLVNLVADGVNQALDGDVKNLRRQIRRIALNDAALYLLDNVPLHLRFKDKYALLSHAVGQVTLEGLHLEFGVFKGKSINHLAKAIAPRIIYGFDSFEGLPDNWKDTRKEDKAVDALPQVRPNVQLIKGWFADSLPGFLAAHPEPFALVHIDSDLYESAHTVFSLAQDRFAPGTVLVFDEYWAYPKWRDGELKAFNEFLVAAGLGFEWLGYNHLGQQVAVKLTTA